MHNIKQARTLGVAISTCLTLAIIAIVINLISDISTVPTYGWATIFTLIPVILSLLSQSITVNKKQAERIVSIWRIAYLPVSLITIIISVATPVFVGFYLGNPQIVANKDFTIGDFILLLIFFACSTILVGLIRVAKKPKMGMKFKINIDIGIGLLISVSTMLEIIKSITAGRETDVITVIGLSVATIGGLGDFTMNYASGENNPKIRRKIHQAGGWLLKQAIKLTISGAGLISLAINFDIVKQIILWYSISISNIFWVKTAYPDFYAWTKSSGNIGYVDDGTAIAAIMILTVGVASAILFTQAIAKAIAGLVEIYFHISAATQDSDIGILSIDESKMK